MDPSTRSLRSLGRDDSMKRRSALSVGTNGRYREEDVIPSGAEGGVEESVGKTGVQAAFVSSCLRCGRLGGRIEHPASGGRGDLQQRSGSAAGTSGSNQRQAQCQEQRQKQRQHSAAETGTANTASGTCRGGSLVPSHGWVGGKFRIPNSLRAGGWPSSPKPQVPSPRWVGGNSKLKTAARHGDGLWAKTRSWGL
jgi:hypothetical protein